MITNLIDLALELSHIDVAHTLMEEVPEEDEEGIKTMAKWKRLSDAVLKDDNFDLYETLEIRSIER